MGQLEEMQVFVRVVDSGGIGNAAEQMGIAKSAVSRRLSELETRLGVSLINRTTRRSNLTEAGQNYYARSQRIINEIKELDSQTSDPDFSLKGTLRISVPLSFGLLHLTPALDLFRREHPELSLDLHFTDRETDLIEGGFDLAFRIGDLSDSSLKARKIAPIKLSLYASPEYLKTHGTPKTPPELKDHNFLKYGISDTNTWKIEDADGHEHSIKIDANITANNGDFLNDMAIAGNGIIYSPSFISWKAVSMGKLIPILTDCRLPLIYAYAVYPQTRYPSKKVRLFIDFLAERFGDNPYWDQ